LAVTEVQKVIAHPPQPIEMSSVLQAKTYGVRNRLLRKIE
jgi:hypothetical protein